MIKFERYSHVHDLVDYYAKKLNREDICELVSNGLKSEVDANNFSRFIWLMVEAINEDEENEVVVLGSTDNTEMLPDINYEVTKLMIDTGFYGIWEAVSNDEMS